MYVHFSTKLIGYEPRYQQQAESARAELSEPKLAASQSAYRLLRTQIQPLKIRPPKRSSSKLHAVRVHAYAKFEVYVLLLGYVVVRCREDLWKLLGAMYNKYNQMLEYGNCKL